MARLRPLAELVDKTLGEALARRGFADSEIIVSWPEIVGPDLAAHSRPDRLIWPKQRQDDAPMGALLVVKAEGGFALELQHLAPLILERLATYFGWRCVERLRFEQARFGKAEFAPPPPVPESPEARKKARAHAQGIADENLRAAIERLGTAILSRQTKKT
jgi:hypothetical protein